MKKVLVILSIIILSVSSLIANASSTDAVLQYNRGIDYYKIGQYDEAISAFRAAVQLDPNYIDAYYNLGSVLEYLQQYDAALAVFKQIIVRKPEDYDSVYKAAWLSAKLGEPQRAKTYLSIIPPTSARAKDAQALATQLNFELEYNPQPKPIQPKIGLSQTSGIYENLPAPTGITTDKEGNVYVAEFNTNTIMKITPDGKKIVHVNDTKVSGPIGLAIDKYNNMYVANYNKDNVVKISAYGEVSVLISNLKKPYYLYIDGNILFISCQGSDSVLRYKLN